MMTDEERKSKLYAFNILLKAKLRAMVVMIKQFHPEWSKKDIKETLATGVDLAYNKEGLKDEPK
jgi:hypothetical protein